MKFVLFQLGIFVFQAFLMVWHISQSRWVGACATAFSAGFCAAMSFIVGVDYRREVLHQRKLQKTLDNLMAQPPQDYFIRRDLPSH